MDISKAALAILKTLNVSDGIPEDKLPKDLDFSLLPYLIDKDLVLCCTIVPPNVEPAYPRGYISYKTSPAGQEELCKANEQKKSRFLGWVGKVLFELFVFLLGFVAAHYQEILETIKELLTS